MMTGKCKADSEEPVLDPEKEVESSAALQEENRGLRRRIKQLQKRQEEMEKKQEESEKRQEELEKSRDAAYKVIADATRQLAEGVEATKMLPAFPQMDMAFAKLKNLTAKKKWDDRTPEVNFAQVCQWLYGLVREAMHTTMENLFSQLKEESDLSLSEEDRWSRPTHAAVAEHLQKTPFSVEDWDLSLAHNETKTPMYILLKDMVAVSPDAESLTKEERSLKIRVDSDFRKQFA